jgi:hypothetical protein
MRFASNRFRALALAVLLVSAAASARAQTYTAIDLGTLPDDYSNSFRFGINERSQVVDGDAINFFFVFVDSGAFLYSGGAIVELGTPPGYSSLV